MTKYIRPQSSRKDLLRIVRKLFKENTRLKKKLREAQAYEKKLMEELVSASEDC